MKVVRKDIGLSLLIECKKATRHGWAFSTIRKSERDVQAGLTRLAYFFTKVGEIIDFSSGHLDIKGFHSADIFTKIGTSCCIPPRQKDDFHEALLQLQNSMRWLRKHLSSGSAFILHGISRIPKNRLKTGTTGDITRAPWVQIPPRPLRTNPIP